ncbi:MAG: DEAD/DEAH box helicase family protein, partial [Clostridia bacterium]|nr:DEAD/DEAH box helicase family protein [Clostridia bacterium]
MELKQYQHRCLDVLKRYFRMCGETCDAAASFTVIAGEFFTGSPAYRELTGSKWLSGIPYVCLRVPTGGGKTLLACHSISVAMGEYKRQDATLVLWLVPSNAILEQTYKTLTNPQHPYYQALSQTLGKFCVKTVDEALNLSRGDIDGQTCIIISTLQAFRRDDKDGLRVYRQNGRLQSFFNTSEQQLLKSELEKDEASGNVACT